MARHIKIAVVCGGPSSEHEVSLNTGRMVLKNLDRRKYDPSLVVISKNSKWRFGMGKPVEIENAIKKLKKFDCVFIAMHGAFGEDGRFQALLDSAHIPYTGSGASSSALAMDKDASNALYESAKFKVPDYIVVSTKDRDKEIKIRLPVVVKPVEGGSSVGTSIVKSKKDLRGALKKALAENGQAIIQKYIKGREMTCGVLEKKNGKLFALPPTEIIPKTSAFFDYGAKYKVGGSLEVTPPQLPKAQIKKLQQMTLKAHALLGCSGMSRSDFILKGSKFFILETNTIPGMTKTSLLPQAAQVAGIDFTSMLNLIIKAALRKK
jgi:D-alanine-D-alanine ligase